MKQFYFMSGLPRSGSTLLTAILNQNTNIHASTNSPLLDTIHYTEEYLLYKSEQYKATPNPEGSHKVLSSIAPNYYCNVPQNIIIDKSRGWVNQIKHIKDYITEDPKIICPVRSNLDILSSFISLIQNSPKVSFIDKELIRNNIEVNNDNRCHYLMSPQGIVGQSLHALSEAFRKKNEKHILLIEYDDLIKNPQQEMNRIYDFLKISRYQHNFNDIRAKVDEDDNVYNLDNMHLIRNKLEKNFRNNLDYLSAHVLNKYSHMEFWRKKSPQYSIFGI